MKQLRGIYNGTTLKERRAIARAIKKESSEFGQEFVEQYHQNTRRTGS